MSQLFTSRSNEQLQRLALLLLILVLGLLNAVFSFIEFRQHRTDQQAAIANQAALVSADLELHIRSINHILEEIAALHDFTDLDQQLERMQSLANAMPIIRGIGILDSRGHPVAGTRLMPKGSHFSDRPYFQNAQADRQRHRLYISRPFRDMTGNISFALSKALIDEHNAFQGVVFAILEPDYIEMLMSATLLTSDMWAALLHMEGQDGLRVGARQFGPEGRISFTTDDLKELLPQIPDRDRASLIWEHEQGSHIIAASAVNAYTGKSDKPLMVVMGRSYEEAMSRWTRLAYIQAGLFLLLAGSAYWGLIFYQYRRREYAANRAADQRLIEEREHDFRIIVERTADCVVRLDADGYCSYMNPACVALFGRMTLDSPHIGFIDLVLPEEKETAANALRLSLESVSEQRLQVKCATNRGLRHMEWTLCSISGDAGRVTGVIAVGRDITAHIALNKELRTRAEHDSLTDLANRGHFLAVASATLEHVDPGEQSFSLLMIDLDHFKQVNDTWGHQAGDLALRTCARTIQEHCRENDIAGRLGGEEFAVLMSGAQQDAAMVAERLRVAIAAQQVNLQDGRQFSLTTSIGVAQRQHNETLEDLIRRADSALYTAKQKGRDRVEVSETGQPSE